MASIKDISEACGVSIATVSKALHDHSDIGEDTKRRVREVAASMGYSPNAAARSLRSKRTYNIGVLYADGSNSGLTHDYFMQILDSFKRSVEEHGYDLTFVNASRGGKDNKTYLEHCRFRGFDGVIAAVVDFANPQVEELICSEIPSVTINFEYEGQTAVMNDDAQGMRELFRYVYGRGHRKIAYVHSFPEMVTRARIEAFTEEAASCGVNVPEEYMPESQFRDAKGAAVATKKLMELPVPPTCILYPDDLAAIGGMNAARSMGLRIPEELSVVGFDGLPVGRCLEPQLTTLWQDTERIGSTAAAQLIRLIEQPRTAKRGRFVIPGVLYEGGTVGRFLRAR